MRQSLTPAQRLFVALDFATIEEAIATVRLLTPLGVYFKVGLPRCWVGVNL
ncbi:hypothetical protein HY933_04020 [Candidatus Falkowbacteria bacterium]|nr:hypothetical protein [Candidatus Falkowbacteria bacterium]